MGTCGRTASRSLRRRWRSRAREDDDGAGRAVDANPLAVPYLQSRTIDAHDCGQAVLAGNHGTVGHEAADLGDQSCDGEEGGGPGGGAAFDDAGGHAEAREVGGCVGLLAGEALAFRREDPRWAERLVPGVGGAAGIDGCVVDGAVDGGAVQLLEGEVVEVGGLVEDACSDETVGLGEQGGPAGLVATHPGVLRILAKADEGADLVELSLE